MHYMDSCSLFTHNQITSWVESMLCMSMHSFGWLGFTRRHIQIKTHKLESHHGALKTLVLSWDQGFERVLHWLISVKVNHNCGTTLYAQHYMKRQRFIKNKVMPRLVVGSVDKVNRIPHTNVIWPTFEGDDHDDVWRVQSQHHHCVNYNICTPFIK
jgi:hypothetical protein